ncbi:MAG TPA: hypothetical protein VKB38_21820 [Terracidiphilus sp.]|nr:hypothetical protein [Terracidiphilus sp.]
MTPKAFGLPAAAFALVLCLAIPLHAQTPPAESENFSTQFVGNADQNSLLALFEGTVPGSPQPALENGILYRDFDDKMMRVDFLELDGSLQQTVLLRFDQNPPKAYDISSAGKTCQASSLTPGTFQSFYGWLKDAKLSPHKAKALILYGGGIAGPVKLDDWEYRYPHGSGISETGLTVDASSNTPIFIDWRLDHPDHRIEVDFDSYTPGKPVKSVFDIPAICNQ